jgi:hypothetical protein
MGLVSLGTNQFWARVQMFFMQPSKFPIEPFTQYMKPNRMRLFTAIQLSLFVLLYVVKAIKTIAIAFPVIIALCIPARLYLLPMIFTQEELVMIDTDERTVKKWLAAKTAAEKQVSFSDDEAEGRNDNDKDIENQRMDVGDGDDRDQNELGQPKDDESNDLVLGLPTKTDLNPTKRSERRKRKKSLSCPESSLLFSEPASRILGNDTDTDGTSVDETSSAYSSDDEPVVPLGERMRMRRRRKKSLSCPPHMLFAEADRHLNNNYFFG